MTIYGKLMMTMLILAVPVCFAGMFTPHDHRLQQYLKIAIGALGMGLVAVGLVWLWS